MDATSIAIRQATLSDATGLSLFSIKSFYDTYAAYNTQADMAAYEQEYFNVSQISKEINTVGNYYFIAFNKEELVGYFKLRNAPPPNELKDLNPIEMERIYVSKNYKGKGIGKLLLDKAIGFATLNAYKILWLGVWEQNEKAIAFYENYGFEKFGNHQFVLGNDVQNDLLYKLEL